jgi:hypothetical protein
MPVKPEGLNGSLCSSVVMVWLYLRAGNSASCAAAVAMQSTPLLPQVRPARMPRRILTLK